jgi:tetratricopeptide (TPR) repeat protein
VEALRRSIESGLGPGTDVETDPDFDPIRTRPDFRALTLARSTPGAPIAAAPPAEAPRPEPGAPAFVGIGIVTTDDPEGARVVRLIPGGPADADGRLRPGDMLLGVEPAPSFTGKPREEVSAALKGAAGTIVRLVVRPAGSGRRAVYELTRAAVRPPDWFRELLALDAAVATAPDDPEPRIERGGHLGRHGDWSGALADFVRAAEIAPENHMGWYRAAPLYLAVGDLAGYRRHCWEMLDRFGATDDPMIAERTAKACLLAPAPVDPGLVTALAERSVVRGADHAYIDYFRLARGMAEARLGDPARAAERLEQVRAAQGDSFREAMAGFFLAIADQRLGRADEARAALRTAVAASGQDGRPPRLGDDLGSAWSDALMCILAAREAEAAVLLDPIFPADPFAR